ncbi:hypothetical protein [Chitinimonas sp. BJB300]|uniref:hypothetical protein n=1 Tax=Chitinimonas sp. BJB300 TaxID=1559339 RepID=UPI0011128610|nr:hypothetical protein [Chitinimonas sp. BJB300]TSJ83746.1 hypothetical protein FG002_021160 [Chitinimonas sp. BJB300]
MRIGENLSPFWQRVSVVLVLLQQTLLFVASLSAIWGWYVVGFGSCLVLIGGLFDQRHSLRCALKISTSGRFERYLAIYNLLLGLIAVSVNTVMAGILLF